MEDGISGGLQHRHETCCEKGSYRGRQACMVQRWFYRGDVISRQVDLHMTHWLIQDAYTLLWQPLDTRSNDNTSGKALS